MSDLPAFGQLPDECPKCGELKPFRNPHYDTVELDALPGTRGFREAIEVLLWRCLSCEYSVATKTKDAA